jgi:DNA-binding NtrC family response regulator
MPFLAGPDLIKKATLLNPNLLVIAVSGYVQEYSLDEVGRFIQKVLPKPFLPSEMLDAVEKALSTARLQCQPT